MGGDKYMSVSRNQSDAIVWTRICLPYKLLMRNLLQWVSIKVETRQP